MCSLELVEVLDTPNSCFRIFSLKIFRGPRTHGCYFNNFQNCHNCDNCCHRDSYLFFSTIATIATIAVIRSQLYLFQNCHNCDNCDGKESIYFFVFRIAIIATIDVTRIFQNCHNCDNCGHRDSYISELHESLLLCQRDAILAIFRIAIIATIVVTGIHLCFFPQLPQLQQLLSSGVNCIFFRIAIIAAIVMKRDPYIFCLQNCHNCDNCDEKGSVYFSVFKIAIIATIDVTRIFQNCHNCDNCCHRDSYFFSTIATIATIVSSGVNCILCFRSAIIATIML